MLQTGQVVRIANVLWRVEYVNECRARVVPLMKRTTILDDGTEQATILSPHNISSHSIVQVVDDIEQARNEIDLEQAERELRIVKRQIEREARTGSPPKPPAPAAQPAVRAVIHGGWHLGPGAAPAFRTGSLAAQVMAYLIAHPGQDTKTIVATLQLDGAVAACLSRFNQAGLIHKED